MRNYYEQKKQKTYNILKIFFWSLMAILFAVAVFLQMRITISDINKIIN